ncbi:hypothetical protein P154DRAFT_366971 [Amniculicola lignicola CBS 123094]|uniref:Uncharacterized protein n=1 Tax=Amniculicola lignicola CBS 123094 TaxID=1392246 RepID=A0A6A5W144_9PLEO|nr:hypothetical protein P154DRAFT_366971 [Amniculicola lignicola CBS 123094]
MLAGVRVCDWTSSLLCRRHSFIHSFLLIFQDVALHVHQRWSWVLRKGVYGGLYCLRCEMVWAAWLFWLAGRSLGLLCLLHGWGWMERGRGKWCRDWKRWRYVGSGIGKMGSVG